MGARAEMVVIVNAENTVTQLSREEVVNIYLGRYRLFPTGEMAHPLDHSGNSQERRQFYRKLLDKGLPEINTYWAKQIFSGRTMPPKETRNQAEMLLRVARDPAAIGYVDRESLNGNNHVKVVFALPD